MSDSFERLWTAVRAVAATTAVMAVLVTAIAFVIETTVHDWYATGKVTLAEAMMAVGFDQSAWTEYWTADGRTVRRSRYGLTTGEAWVVRHRLLSMAVDRVLLGAITGLVVGVLWLRAPKAARPSRPGRSSAVVLPKQMPGPCYPVIFPGTGGPFAGRRGSGGDRARMAFMMVSETELEPLLERGGGINPAGDPKAARSEANGSARPEAPPDVRVPAPPPADAATRASADHPSGSKAQRPTGSEPVGERRAETVTGKEGSAASAGRRRRKRDHGRWI
ncbi:MAG: hypothetical protein OXU63_12085 [Acidobacteriota bacterium]|nr:hypothetical protein [Acidobacteriota bacterium]